MALVLCTGVDRNLVFTRKLLLERAGHSVVTALSEQEIAAACSENHFDVAVIGQAVSNEHKKRIFHTIRRHSADVKVLELYPPYLGRILPEADDWLQVPLDVPPELGERVSSLASRN
jgi:hypothetical protein